MLREVDTDRLAMGMYVAELDRPWLETPFQVQGFYIRSPEDVQRLAEVCQSVFVDPRRYDPRIGALARAPAADLPPRRSRGKRPAAPVAQITYEDAEAVEEELPAARSALGDGGSRLAEMWSAISAKRNVRIEDVRRAVDPLVDSILRNKDALVTLMRVKDMDRNTHEHCVALAVWGGLLGRQLGLPPDGIRQLALGCSLVDIGKVRLPKQLLYRAGPLSEAEFAIVQSHVDYSIEMVRKMGTIEQPVLETVRWHHERMDGSGYPDGLANDGIPLFARVAGIVDSYDAMISQRSYAPTCSSYEALVELQDHPERFQSELVDQFVQAIGLFPNGALVELSSGEVGVVCGQNPGRRLRPKVMLILDADKRQRGELLVLDLKQRDEHELRVSRELARNEYGIDAGEFFL